MSKNKGTDYFYFKPFRSGSVSFPRPNEAIYVIDVLSRDDIVYFDDFVDMTYQDYLFFLLYINNFLFCIY